MPEIITTSKLEILKNKINSASTVLLILYIVLDTLNKTIFSMYFYSIMEKTQYGVAGILIILFLLKLVALDNNWKKKWVSNNCFILIYFVIRLLCLVHVGFEYTVIRSLVFEIIYLVVLSEVFINSALCRRIILRFFISTIFVLNIINTFFYLYCTNALNNGTYMQDNICQFALKYTYIQDIAWYCSSSMYSNPNFLGLVTGLTLLLSLVYYPKDKRFLAKLGYLLFFGFSLYCIWYSNCSSSHVGLIIVLITAVIVNKTHFVTQTRVVVACLLCCVLATACIIGFINSNNNEFGQYSLLEERIDYYSSQRYTIWKDCYYSHQDEAWLGCGNITLEKRDRYQYNLDKGIDLGLDIRGSLIEYVGPHNGYIGMISCTGILGFIAFILLLLKKIVDAKALKTRHWYLAVIFILIINLFECMMPISKNFCSLYMFIILAMGDDNNEKNLPLESEE